MYESFLNYGFPILIILTMVSFIWAWAITAVKSPEESEEKEIWKYREDAGPEGIRKTVSEKLRPRTQV